MDIHTQLIHPKDGTNYADGATLPPISQVNAYTYSSAEEIESVFWNRAPGFAYTRIGNPTTASLEARINELEGGIGAIACASGMSAVSFALLNVLQSGDEIIAGSGLFGGTLDLFRDIEAFGIHVRYADGISVETVAPLITDRTRVVFGEVIENPGLKLMDIRRTADFLHQRGIPLIVDSTTSTPVLVRPIAYGADIVVHSTSKYIDGSSNSIGGIIIDGGTFRWDPDRYPGFARWKKYGKFSYLMKLRNGLWRNMGGCLSPTNAYLSVIGLETLALRMERCCENAAHLAAALDTESNVAVRYPGLHSDEEKELIKRQFHGYAGAIVTLRTDSKESAYQLMNSLKYAGIASNIGDVRTLVIHPASTIYMHSDQAARETAGVYDGTIRVSVGIEHVDDLIEDFTAAIRAL